MTTKRTFIHNKTTGILEKVFELTGSTGVLSIESRKVDNIQANIYYLE